ncbi:MAG: YdeI/OmpD-associated family protein [Flavitalea sp.]
METKNGIQTLYAKDRKAWRSWLEKNCATEKSVWLIIYRKDAQTKSVNYPDAVEEALCFGWIDSKPNKRDDESFYQFFAKRNPTSNWSKINKERVKKLVAEGFMTPAGMNLIEQAKANGAWSALDAVESLVLPPELQKSLSNNKEAAQFFDAFPRSVKKGILEWIQNAKTPETKNKRIEETVRLAEKNIRANQYIPKTKRGS